MSTLAQLNKQRWDACKIPESMAPAFRSAASRITANKARYDKVSKLTGVPWWFIGVVHYRESNLNFNTYLGNGQALNKKTTIVPKGRGPFASWEDGAVDALVNCAPYAARNRDWSVGGSLAMLEQYNGLGYAGKGLPSPYIWSGTNQYTKGKYVSDGVFSATAVDKQLGCAGIIKFLGIFNSNAGTAAGATAAGAGVFATLYHWGEQALPYVIIVGGLSLLAYGVYSFLQFRKTLNVQ